MTVKAHRFDVIINVVEIEVLVGIFGDREILEARQKCR